MKQVLITFFLLSACTHLPEKEGSVKNRINSQVPGNLYKLETRSALDFLEKPCKAPNPNAFEKAWRAHEEAFSLYQTLYYQDARDEKEKSSLAHELASKQKEVCLAIEKFIAIAPQEIHRAALEMEKLLGALPAARILFTVPLKWTDGMTGVLDGRPVIALSARHPTFQRERGLRATIFHELFHDVQGALFAKESDRLSPLENSLYREGGATYAVETQYPDIGRKALGLNDEKLKLADQNFQSVLKRMKQVLDGKEKHPDFERDWFSGGEHCSPYPCKMGYVIGNKVFHEIAQSLGREKTLRISPLEFKRHLRLVLNKI